MTKYTLSDNTLIPAPIPVAESKDAEARFTLTDLWILFALLAFFDLLVWVAW